jgi:NAD(P)-dependent dehydrogenase (short-subunit alcohol dehydrogenase family)
MAAPSADSLTTVSLQTLTKTFNVNTFGPLLLTQALLPNLLLSTASPPKIANVSSRVGSIVDNSSCGSYAYRASKAALNSISKSMAVDLKEKGVAVVILHPGIVKTGMTTDMENLQGAVEPEEAVSRLWSVLQAKVLEETGRFWHRSRVELEW